MSSYQQLKERVGGGGWWWGAAGSSQGRECKNRGAVVLFLSISKPCHLNRGRG